MNTKAYAVLASAVGAYHNCVKANNTEWQGAWEDVCNKVCKELLPSGSGFDCGTKIDLDKSTGDKLVLTTSYHHMNENGMYDGWTEHTITITPSLWAAFHVTVTGRNRNDIKSYIAEVFQNDLDQEAGHIQAEKPVAV